VLLGLREGIAHFAVDVSPLAEPEQTLGVAGVAKFQEPRAIAALLPVGEGGILAQARSLVDWHVRHRFCSTCGARTKSGEGGYQRACPDCSAQHFPRTDPVVIMLVARGDACLLGRQAAWPPRMFSALAGFVEPGETLEEAVRREVLEEAGIEVAGVRYHSSQPWPFPASLMIGCIAEAASEAIRIDPGELSEARWFSRDEIKQALAQPGTGDLFVPPPMAIAHHLIRAFAEGT
jgi:NAD+ diphosphatase